LIGQSTPGSATSGRLRSTVRDIAHDSAPNVIQPTISRA
jgi:hypothetical protein